MENMNKRIEWVDIAKFICALFVIIIHLESNTSLLGKFYEPFLLNGFLFLSGYTFRFRDGFPSFLARKIRQLLIPWLFFGLMIVISGNIYSPSPDSHSGILNDLFWFLVQIREKNDAMWFVAALFISYIPFYFLVKFYIEHKDNKWIRPVLIMALTLLYFIELYY
jgi:fucose 4-O-acetylase-like acetyltransferase